MSDWTVSDSTAAEAEGWDIFDSAGSNGGPWQLQRFDTPDEWSGAPKPYPFETDADVWEHVAGRAAQGSALHARALVFLRAHNPLEYDAIWGHLAAVAGESQDEQAI